MVQALLVLGVMSLGQGQVAKLPGSGLTGQNLDFFQKVIARPTGRNGYEEYVEAAAWTKHPEFGVFATFEGWVNWSDRFNQKDAQGRYRWSPDKEGVAELVVLPPELTFDATMLDVRQAWVRRFGGILDIVKRGNLKPVAQPRERIDMDTLFPELAQFKALAKFFVTKSQVEFGVGSSAAATDALVEGLKFSRNMGDGPMIQMLVSVACTSIILAGFEQGLGRLSLQDANSVLKVCKELLARPALSEAAFASEFQALGMFSKDVVERPELVVYTVGDGPDELVASIQNLDPKLKPALRERVVQYLDFKQKQLKQVLAKPEREWHRTADQVLPVSSDDRDPVDGLAAQIVNRLSPAYSQSLQSQAKVRAQLRILRATARVIAYKWVHGQLPKSLEDAAPAAEIEDPASGQKLRYEVPLPGVFQIQSDGFGTMGPIGLRYRKSAPTGDPPDSSVKPPALELPRPKQGPLLRL